MIKIKNNKIIKYLAVIGLLVFLYAIGLLRPLEGNISKIFNPLLNKVYIISSTLQEKYNNQTSKNDLAQIVKNQQKEINKLLSANAELIINKEENEKLRQYLQFFSQYNYKKILAGVISRGSVVDLANRVEVIRVDRGSKDGLVPGLLAIDENGIVIGKIAEVKDSVASINLVTNKKCRLAATLLNQNKTSGLVEGELGLTMIMNFIPQTENIQKDDIIVTSGLEKFIPRGLVIGQVTDVVKTSNELWQQAVLEPSINLDNITMVAILLAKIDN